MQRGKCLLYQFDTAGMNSQKEEAQQTKDYRNDFCNLSRKHRKLNKENEVKDSRIEQLKREARELTQEVEAEAEVRDRHIRKLEEKVPTYEDAEYLNRCLSWQMEGRGLIFVKLDVTSLRIVAFTDSSFANNKDLSSQIGYVIALADAQNNANIIHWQSIKCRRVTRSVLASELYALSLGFDVAATIKSTLDQIFSGTPKGKIPLSMCIDSKSLYECLVKLGTTQEKRLMIDILCLRQSYERREITEILWIKGNNNPADAMTKDKGCDALQRLVDTNHLELELEGWVEREDIDQ